MQYSIQGKKQQEEAEKSVLTGEPFVTGPWSGNP